MSNLLSQASLVIIPSGYKEDVVYSQIPTDGSGDLSFTRAGNGTRINSAGLVEVCPWNDLTYSEEFNNAAWSKFDASATANATTAPNGTTTADKFVEGTGSSIHRFNQGGAIVSGQSYTFSVYAKASERTRLLLRTNNGSADQDTYFDLTNGTIVSGTGTIENAGNGWYKLSRSLTATTSVSSNFICQLLLVNTGTNTSYTGDGTSGLFVWGAQLNIGSTAKPYFPTTDRLNVPRLTYQNGGGGCPSLLLEKQSTNLALYSEQFDNNTYWTQSVLSGTLTRTANYGISPDGTQNADRIQMSITTGYVDVLQVITTTPSVAYSYSIWLKSLSGTPTIVFLNDGVTGNKLVTLTTEWVRYTFNIPASGALTYPRLLIENGITSTSADILAWGAQLEQSSYVTSYIPTTSSSATRVADACFKTGISSLIGQTEGTLFADFVITGLESLYGTAISVNDGVANNYVWLTIFANGNLRAEVWNGSVQASITYSGAVVGSRYKMAFGYKTNDFVLYVNGTQVGTDNSGTTFSGTTLSRVDNNLAGVATNNVSQSLNQWEIFPTRLTNAQLVELTTI